MIIPGIPDFKVQVRAARAARIARKRHDLTLFEHKLIRIGIQIYVKIFLLVLLVAHVGGEWLREFLQMPVHGRQAVGMAQVDDIAVAAALHGDSVDVAIRRRVYCQALALLGADVEAAVEVIRPQITQDTRQRIRLTGHDGEKEVIFGVRFLLGERTQRHKGK